MIGKTLGHYEILEKIGQGGMGEVYRARDTKLGREVALKTMPGAASEDMNRRTRFHREAMAVAALQHPNIVTIHSVEEDGETLFLTMELVEGQSLDYVISPNGFNLSQLLDIAIPVVEAVSYAHQKGIMHRDLKPQNIMQDERGHLKVLDFGLAKLLAPEEGPEMATLVGDGSVTKEGSVVGTASYMSPEQAEGKSTDARSDIFSLGTILYEMATGQKPFQGDTTISTISAVLKDTPTPVTELNRSLPNHMGRVIGRCLAKDPARRYQTAQDLINELEGIREESSSSESVIQEPIAAPAQSAPPPTADSAIVDGGSSRKPLLLGGGALFALAAVLVIWQPWGGGGVSGTDSETQTAIPASENAAKNERMMAVVFPFENLGPSDQAYFAAGVSEEITSRLSAVSGLGVISRTSAVQYDRSGKTLTQIGNELGVDYVLEGTVRWAKNPDGTERVRITPQLIRAADDNRLWSETYDREINDIFEVQSDIASRVITELGVTLMGSEAEKLEERPTDNIEAYQAYLQYKELGPTLSFEEQDRQSIELLETATRLDPGFLAAWYELTSHHLGQYNGIDRTELRLSKAKEAVDSAEGIDPNHPFSLLARGYYHYYGFRDYDRALGKFTAALKLLPNETEVLQAIGYIHRRQGKLDEAIQDLEKAATLDPENDAVLRNLANTYWAMRQFDRASQLFDRCLELEPGNDQYRLDKAQILIAWKGDLAEARSALGTEPGNNPLFYHFGWWWLHTMARDYEKALEQAERVETESPFMRAAKLSLTSHSEMKLNGADQASKSLTELVKACEEVLKNSPGNTQVRTWLAAGKAYLGDKSGAVREAKLAAELVAKDAYSGPSQLADLARVYSVVGRYEDAIELLDRLLATNYEGAITVPSLQIDPDWDTLRNDPAFVALLEKYGEKLP